MEQLRVAYYDLANLGDQLNRLLLPKVLGELVAPEMFVDPFRRHSGVAAYAIGSYLSEEFFAKFDASFRGVVLGAGIGYPQFPRVRSLRPGRLPETGRSRLRLPLPSGVPALSLHYRVAWVRGPISARLLGLAPDAAVADAAYMVRQCDLVERARAASRSGVAFMPHLTAARSADGLERLCGDLGITYLDPRAPPERLLDRIAAAELLVSEALHGAVIADAFRTPWVPVWASGAVHEVKWRDFTASIGLDYRPFRVRVRWGFRPRRGPRLRAALDSLLLSGAAALGRVLVSERDTALDLLRAASAPPMLSRPDRIAEIDERLHGRLAALREAWRAGRLFAGA